ncbi:MAG: hypothetical protein D4R77_01030 [Planctomycetaceae bacterium]|nr:MAG: hypothetical protein D4R77_01030 [Planctomycetaceae bacterium]
MSLGFFLSQEHVKEKGDSQSVTATIQLGRRGLSKNGYERFLFSRSFHSPPSLKAASPADLARVARAPADAVGESCVKWLECQFGH